MVLVSLPFSTQRISTTVEKLWIFNKIPRPARMNMWKQVLARLEQSIERADYVQWFAPTRFVAQKGETVDVSVPSQRFIDEIRERYGQQIRTILGEISPERIQVHFVVDPDTSIDDVPIPAAPPRDEIPTAVAFAATLSASGATCGPMLTCSSTLPGRGARVDGCSPRRPHQA